MSFFICSLHFFSNHLFLNTLSVLPEFYLRHGYISWHTLVSVSLVSLILSHVLLNHQQGSSGIMIQKEYYETFAIHLGSVFATRKYMWHCAEMNRNSVVFNDARMKGVQTQTVVFLERAHAHRTLAHFLPVDPWEVVSKQFRGTTRCKIMGQTRGQTIST